jgi:hypothetical protein
MFGMTIFENIRALVMAVYGSLLILLLATILLLPTSVTAEEIDNNSAPIVCDDRTTIVSSLSENYKETRNSIGLANSGSVVEVFSATDGSWSMIVTRPDGTACLIAAGRNWESMSQKNGQRI